MTEETKKNKGGRPTKYKEEYCQELLDFFTVNHTKTVIKRKHTEKQGEVEYEVEEPNTLPTFEKFAVSIDVNTDTLLEWKNKKNKDGTLFYPKFSAAYKKAKNLQKAMLVDLGMRGLYNPTFTIFVAKNITDMHDVQRQEVSGPDGQPLETKTYTLAPATKEAIEQQKKERVVIDD